MFYPLFLLNMWYTVTMQRDLDCTNESVQSTMTITNLVESDNIELMWWEKTPLYEFDMWWKHRKEYIRETETGNGNYEHIIVWFYDTSKDKPKGRSVYIQQGWECPACWDSYFEAIWENLTCLKCQYKGNWDNFEFVIE